MGTKTTSVFRKKSEGTYQTFGNTEPGTMGEEQKKPKHQVVETKPGDCLGEQRTQKNPESLGTRNKGGMKRSKRPKIKKKSKRTQRRGDFRDLKNTDKKMPISCGKMQLGFTPKDKIVGRKNK